MPAVSAVNTNTRLPPISAAIVVLKGGSGERPSDAAEESDR